MGQDCPPLPPVLTIRNARKSFGANQALRGAAFELRDRELLALLGPNGAGKTPLIRAIAGRVRLDEGEIELFGEKIDATSRRRLLAVVPQELALYGLLTARENLAGFGRLNGVSSGRIKDKVGAGRLSDRPGRLTVDGSAPTFRASSPVRRH